MEVRIFNEKHKKPSQLVQMLIMSATQKSQETIDSQCRSYVMMGRRTGRRVVCTEDIGKFIVDKAEELGLEIEVEPPFGEDES